MEVFPLALEKIQAIVLQPTPFCNIDCRYCYLPQRSVKETMSLAVLRRALELFFSSSRLSENVSLLWHAGEPLVVPLAYYHEALSLVARLNTRGVTVIPMLQTNGMLITQAWCDFIKQHNIRIGVSLDGPQYIHDRSRVDRSGRGTFERAMRGIRLLQANGIEPSIIMVLTREALAYPDEIWQFFQEQHLTNLAFNVEEVNGAHTRSSLSPEADTIEAYKRFLWRMLELRERSTQPPFIREIDTFLERIRLLNTAVRSQENLPGVIVSVDAVGNVSTFVSELLTMRHPHHGDLLLGNIFSDGLEELLTSPKLRVINSEIRSGVLRCQQSCDYFAFCGGGSPANKLSEHATFDTTETLYCQLKIKTTLDTILEYGEQCW